MVYELWDFVKNVEISCWYAAFSNTNADKSKISSRNRLLFIELNSFPLFSFETSKCNLSFFIGHRLGGKGFRSGMGKQTFSRFSCFSFFPNFENFSLRCFSGQRGKWENDFRKNLKRFLGVKSKRSHDKKWTFSFKATPTDSPLLKGHFMFHK